MLAIAAPSEARVTSREVFTNQDASLSIDVYDRSECANGQSATLRTRVYLAVQTHAERGQAATTTAYASVVQDDYCTGTFWQAHPVVANANASNSGIEGATLDESFELIDYDSGEPRGFLDVALDFRRNGDVTHRYDRVQNCTDGVTERTQQIVDERLAETTGTVSLNGASLPTGGGISVLGVSRTRNTTTERARCACSSSDFTPDEDRELPNLPAGVTSSELHGEFAAASFETEEPLTCDDGSAGTLATTLGLDATESESSASAGSGDFAYAFAYLERFDSCTGETVVGEAPLYDLDYDQLGITSATLDATFELSDPQTGAFVGLLDAAAVFTGTGAKSCSSSLSIQDALADDGTGRVFLVTRTQGQSRDATLAGTIAFEGSELMSGANYASLRTDHQTSVRVEY